MKTAALLPTLLKLSKPLLVLLPLTAARADVTTYYTVNSSASSDNGTCLTGACTLSEAIQDANTTEGGNVIQFNIPASDPNFDAATGTARIPFTSTPLPILTRAGIFIDGSTQPGSTPTSPKVMLQGDGSGVTNGLRIEASSCIVKWATRPRTTSRGRSIEASSCIVKGLRVVNFGGTGILINTGGSNSTVLDCVLGIRPNNSDGGNFKDGLRVQGGAQNCILGSPAGGRIFSGFNRENVVRITGANTNGNVLSNSVLGVAPGGAVAANSASGVRIDGGAKSNTIGLALGAPNGNTIGFNGTGVIVSGFGTNLNTIQGNYIGTNASGVLLANTGDGVVIEEGAQSNIIGSNDPASRNLFAAQSFNIDKGVRISGSLTNFNRVIGNTLGLNAVGNGLTSFYIEGVRIERGASSNVIGGSAPGEGNTIFAQYAAVQVLGVGTNSNTIAGNFLGVTPAGVTPAGVTTAGTFGDHLTANGIVVLGGATNTTVGGVTAGARNVIGNTNQSGVVISSRVGLASYAPIAASLTAGTRVIGNWIGLAADGITPASCLYGVELSGSAQANIIGGAAPGEGNVIGQMDGYNEAAGVFFADADTQNNQVRGNLIGANTVGTRLPMPIGVDISPGVFNNSIGGTLAGQGNRIVGATIAGVRLRGKGTTNNAIFGNAIGGDAAGNPGPNLGNAVGILAIGCAGNRTLGNRIAYSTGDGIRVENGASAQLYDPASLLLRGDATIANGGLGINMVGAGDLPNGVTPNDAGDPDAGPNGLQNVPIITSIVRDAASITVSGTLNSLPSSTYAIEVFSSATADPSGSGEGEVFLGRVENIATDAAGNANWTLSLSSSVLPAGSIAPGRVLSATASTATATSELSPTAAIAAQISLSIPASIAEGASAQATISRDGDVSQPLTVALTSSDPAALSVPASVVIPAGQASVAFTISAVKDAVAQGARSAVISASAPGAGSATPATVAITDDDAPGLGLQVLAGSINEGASTTGTITRNTPLNVDLVVALSSSDASAATVPASVTIPSGSASVDFAIAGTSDGVVDGAQAATITASSTGLAPATTTVTVNNVDVAGPTPTPNPTPTPTPDPTPTPTPDPTPTPPTATPAALSLSIAPSVFREDAGMRAATATLSRTGSTSANLIVALASSDLSEARVPAIVSIPSGARSATFAVAAADDSVADGPQRVKLVARASAAAGADAFVTVLDNETPALSLTLVPARIRESRSTTASLTIRRNTEITPRSLALVVALAASPAGQLVLPRSIVIPARAASVTVRLVALNDLVADGPRRIRLSARAAGFPSASVALTVEDDEAASRFSITGRVLTDPARANGAIQGIPQVLVALRVGAVVYDEVLSDGAGSFRFSGLPSANYTVSVAKLGWSFAPPARALRIVDANALGVLFAGTARTSIRGRLTRPGSGGQVLAAVGVAVRAESIAGSFTAVTNARGEYQLSNLSLGAYRIAPLQPGSVWTPRFLARTLSPAVHRGFGRGLRLVRERQRAPRGYDPRASAAQLHGSDAADSEHRGHSFRPGLGSWRRHHRPGPLRFAAGFGSQRPAAVERRGFELRASRRGVPSGDSGGRNAQLALVRCASAGSGSLAGAGLVRNSGNGARQRRQRAALAVEEVQRSAERGSWHTSGGRGRC